MLDSVRFRKGSLWMTGAVLALVSCQQVDAAETIGKNARAAFNSAAEIGVSNTKADSRRTRPFLRPSHTIGASSSMAGRGGRAFVLAGPLVPVRQSRHAPATPDWRRDGGAKPTKEASMPKSISRALLRLFPAITRPVATFPIEAEAVTFARAYLAQTGRAVTIAPAVAGFEVIGGAA